MKNFARLSILLVVLLGIYFLLLLIFPKKSSPPFLADETFCKSIPGYPSRLIIPAININATIEELGITADDEMAVPGNILNVGWYKYGPKPGESGSTVIAGHFDGKKGEAGIFAEVFRLKQGDIIYVEDITGVSTAFKVRESRNLEPGYAEEVFDSSGSARLNLVTCDGVWNKNAQSYSNRLVIMSDIIR